MANLELIGLVLLAIAIENPFTTIVALPVIAIGAYLLFHHAKDNWY